MIPIITSIYGLMSLITFAVYYLDKRAARLGRPRTPEVTLHVLELLGGWPGALLAQRLERQGRVSGRVLADRGGACRGLDRGGKVLAVNILFACTLTQRCQAAQCGPRLSCP